MKISLDWLQDFIDLRVRDPEEIGRRIAAGVAEVDAVEILGRFLDNCCVGKVLKIEKHPGADRLSVCEVQTDTGKKRVVCGGTNLREGMRVAFAHIGAKVKWHGGDIQTLAPVKIRGVPSEGMICAAEELEIESKFAPRKDHGERPIVDFGDGDDGVGTSLRQFLGMNDVVFHIDNHAITHRADLFSHVGFAREFVALGLATWKASTATKAKRATRTSKAMVFPKKQLPFKCIVDCKNLVPRYTATFLEVDEIGETPAWMKRRLEATGWRSVSLPVDVTNYVAMEIGMPLHCFDADDIRGDVHMRTAKEGETIVTLDDVERVLPEGAIVLSDDEGIFDLLGIMGGLRSSTKAHTRRMFLHAAIVDPMSIRRAIIATGHRTDASTVYEKGVPRCVSTPGLLRAVELFLQLVPGARAVSALEEWGDDGKAKPIALPLAMVPSVLGADVPAKTIKKILGDLEFSVKAGSAKQWTVTPPLHRLGDIRGPHDLVEEIGRVYGYDTIEDRLPAADIVPPPRDSRLHGIRDALKASAYNELLPLSLVGAGLLAKAGINPSSAVVIKNPLGEELKLLQPSTLPSLLEHAERSVPLLLEHLHDRVPGRLRDAVFHPDAHLRTFTAGHVFSKTAREHTELGILVASMRDAETSVELLDSPLLLLKEELRMALQQAGFALEVASAGSPPPFAHPGRYAEVFAKSVAGAGAHSPSIPPVRIGTFFEIHPSLAATFGLRHRAAAALLDLDALLALPPMPLVAHRVPAFPAISYDMTMPLRHTEQLGELFRRFRGSHALLESVETKDLYTGSAVEKGSYNVTLRFTYRASDRTLTEDDAKKAHAKVTEGL